MRFARTGPRLPTKKPPIRRTEPTAYQPTETERPGSAVHGRMFPTGVGIAEDPATGSAAGPLAAYLVRHGLAKTGERSVIEQGFEIGRPSLLYARIDGSAERITAVHVGGNVIPVGGGWFDL